MTLPSPSFGTSGTVHKLPRPNDTWTRVAGSLAGTTVLNAAVSIPNVIRLHLLSDLTPTAWLTDSILSLVNLSRTRSFLPTSAPNVVTTRQLVFNSKFVPMCVPTVVPPCVAIRHLALEPISELLRPSVSLFWIHIPSLKFSCSNFCDHPTACSEPYYQLCDHSFQPCLSKHRTAFCSRHFAQFAVPHHWPTLSTTSNHQTLKCIALDWTVFVPHASIAVVAPLVPCRVTFQKKCSNRSTKLHQSSCHRDRNSCPSALCIIDQYMFLVCLRHPPVREIPSSLSCHVVCPFLCSCSCIGPHWTCLRPCLGLVCLCPC